LRLLLDTHIWLWSLLEPERLTRRVATALKSANNELWLSPISVWETMQLLERGRLEVDAEPSQWVYEMLRAASLREAPLTHDVAIQAVLVDLPHRDPADRLIAASAKVHELTLVTADDRLLGLREITTLANRG
jgi:PIN domain nuclease of toxin-antitoxin system